MIYSLKNITKKNIFKTTNIRILNNSTLSSSRSINIFFFFAISPLKKKKLSILSGNYQFYFNPFPFQTILKTKINKKGKRNVKFINFIRFVVKDACGLGPNQPQISNDLHLPPVNGLFWGPKVISQTRSLKR